MCIVQQMLVERLNKVKDGGPCRKHVMRDAYIIWNTSTKYIIVKSRHGWENRIKLVQKETG
jgi:hypothetical protein